MKVYVVLKVGDLDGWYTYDEIASVWADRDKALASVTLAGEKWQLHKPSGAMFLGHHLGYRMEEWDVE